MIRILAPILLLFSFSGSAQPFVSLLDTNNLWSNLHATGYPPTYTKITQWIKLDGDTIIDSNVYKRVFEAYDEFHQNWSLVRFMREDSSGRVFARLPNMSADILMYDFSIDVGDTIFSFFTVYSVSTQWFNGTARKVITFGMLPWVQWIEGIGCTRGLLDSYPEIIVGGFDELLCQYNQGSQVYSSPNYPGCYYHYVVGEEEHNIPEFSVFPNPSHGSLFIENADHRFARYSLFNTEGICVKNGTLSSSVHEEGNIRDLAAGLYILRMEDEDGQIVSRKMVVQ